LAYPASYIAALQRLRISPSHALIVENAPLGVQAANNAGIKCIVLTLPRFLFLISMELLKMRRIYLKKSRQQIAY
jgi:beta-phosphoglucomutase-like phosphatase (HAD superfamily)